MYWVLAVILPLRYSSYAAFCSFGRSTVYHFVFFLHMPGKAGGSNAAINLTMLRGTKKLLAVLASVGIFSLPG